MTEYGVQTNNLFDVLEQADEAAKPKPKTNRRKKKNQRGKTPGGQATPTTTVPGASSTQPPKAATTQSSAVKKPDSQPGAAKPQVQAQQVRPTQSAQQQPKPAAGGSFQIQEPARRPPTQGQGQGQGPQTGGRGNGNNRGNARGGQGPNRSPQGQGRPQGQGQGQGQGRSPQGQGRPQGQGQGRPQGQGQGRPQGQGQGRPQGQARTGAPGGQESDAQVRKLDQSHVSFEEESDPKHAGRGEGPRRHDNNKHQAPQHGRHTFDRHSGTGITPNENKKGGAGAANWGKPGVDELAAEEDLKVELQGEQAAQAEAKEARKKKKKKKGKDEEAEADKKDEIPDESLKLFSEWEAEQKKKAAKLALPKARAAGEGVNEDPKWTSAVKLDKDAAAEEFVKVVKKEPVQVASDAKKTKSQVRRERRRQAVVEQEKKLATENITTLFDFSAKPQEEGGRGRGRDRGGRGGGRHGGGRGHRNEGEGAPAGRFNNRPPREGGRGAHHGNRSAPKLFRPDSDAPHFDDNSFPALHVGPPITAQ